MRERLRTLLRPLTEGCSIFLEWWGAELVGLVPSRWRAGRLGWRSPPVLRLAEDGTALIGDPGSEESPVMIELPKSHGMRRSISLPLRAESDLAAVLEFEIDRLTPFRADQLWYGGRILERDTARGILLVELCAVPRRQAEAALALAESRGLRPVALSVAGGPAVNLLPRVRRRQSWWADPWKLIAVGNLLLLLFGLAALYGYTAITADRLAAKLVLLRAEAVQAENLRIRLDAARKEARFLASKRAAPHPVEVIAELSQLLPDQAWLYDVAISGRSLRIAGYAASVPEILDRLSQARLFADPRLASPVVHGANDTQDRFELTLTIREQAS